MSNMINLRQCGHLVIAGWLMKPICRFNQLELKIQAILPRSAFLLKKTMLCLKAFSTTTSSGGSTLYTLS